MGRLTILTAGIVAMLGLLASAATAELPKVLTRADWVGDDVIQVAGTGGPETVPKRLYGTWRVSLCVRPGWHRAHAWIRYENVVTGEVHTVGKFQKWVRPTRRRRDGEVLYPGTRTAGLHWDYDWRYEHEVRQGKYVIDSVVVHDPWIFRDDDPRGHGTVRNNCVTYARDAWAYYSGQQFDLPVLHTAEGFLRKVADSETGEVSLANDPSRLQRLPPVHAASRP